MGNIEDKVDSILKKKRYCSIATSDGKVVDNAMVEYYSEDFNIYFGSLNNTLKCQHIKLNSHVAICIDNMQIHGIAYLLEKDTEVYKEFAKKFLSKFPNDKFYFEMVGMNFFVVKPLVIWWYDLSLTYQREKIVFDIDYYKNLNAFENPEHFNKVVVPWLEE